MARSMPVTFVAEAAASTLDLSAEVLKRQFKERFADLAEVLSDIPRHVGDYSPTDVTVCFTISASGAVSLLATPAGSPVTTATFSFRLSRQTPD